MAMTAMDHVRYLSDTIGPRGSTTSNEEEAARYASRMLSQMDLKPVTEHFISARSGWYPYALFSALLLVSEILSWLGGQWGAVIAVVLTVFSLISVLLELAFRPNPFRWLLPKGRSQNVWARISSRNSPKEKVVLLGHLDTHRTPLVFSTDKFLKLFRILVPAGLVFSVILLFIFAVEIFSGAWFWRFLSLPFAIVVVGILVLTLQADRTDYTAGANDNATGAGIVLSLAEQLKKKPLVNTSVWVVLTGCEEVGCYGADAFAQAHGDELNDAAWITLDSVGSSGGRPCYLTKETFLLTARSDSNLVKLAEGVANKHPELNACAYHKFSGAYTEGSIGAKYGLRVLTLIAFTPDGKLTEWHRPTDVLENVDLAVVECSEKFLWKLLQEIDQRAEKNK
jgi:hypothetical protein